MATQASGVNTWLTLNGKPLLFAKGATNLAAKAVEYDYNHLRLTRGAPDGIEIRVDGQPLETEIYGRWTWRPAGFAGLYELEVSAPGFPSQKTEVRVLPSKISHERHEWMLKEIAEFSADLLFQLHSPATERVSPADLEQMQSPLRTFRLVERLMEDLAAAMAQVERMPHRALVSHTERRQWHEVNDFSAGVTPVPGPAVAIPVRHDRLPAVWPAQWDVRRGVLTYDVYENRLLKQFLWRQLLPRLYEIEDRARQEIERRKQSREAKLRNTWNDDETERIVELEAVVADCLVMQRQVIGWGSLPFLRDVRLRTQRTVPSQVLQKHPAYGRFYQVFLRFQRELRRGLNTDGFLTRIALRKMSELYEMWSVFRLTRLILFLLRRFDYQLISSEGFFRVDDEFFHFEVDRDAEIVLSKAGKRVVIRYEPTYPPMDSVPQGLVTKRRYQRTPDLAVELWEGGRATAVLIFDAKYKTEMDKGRSTFLDEDVQKMSAYHSEIAWKERHGRAYPRSAVASAYILYPGEVLEHNPHMIEVGALPFVPGPKQQDAVNQALVDLLVNAGLV